MYSFSFEPNNPPLIGLKGTFNRTTGTIYSLGVIYLNFTSCSASLNATNTTDKNATSASSNNTLSSNKTSN